ncbi:MAG: sugar phosphorylase, partial [Anaerolineales bacterium]
MDIPKARIQKHLTLLYGQAEADRIWPQLRERLDDFRQRCPHLQDAAPPEQRLTERDAILITYADQFRAPDAPPLATLCDFAEAHLGDAISGVHLLPFYPYSSDDGFSVIDYREVDPDAGSWEDAARLGRKYR